MPIAVFENHATTPMCMAALIVHCDRAGVFDTVRFDRRHVEEVGTCSLFLNYTAKCRGSSLHYKSSNAYQGSKFDAGSHVFREV